MRVALPFRACLLAGLTWANLQGLAWAHSYPTGQMTVLHPWTDPVPAGTASAVLSLRIVDIQSDDCLLGAQTAVAERIEIVRALDESSADGIDPDAPCAIALRAGEELAVSAAGSHLRMLGINRDLAFGAEYPLQLRFAKAGVVDVDLVISAPE